MPVWLGCCNQALVRPPSRCAMEVVFFFFFFKRVINIKVKRLWVKPIICWCRDPAWGTPPVAKVMRKEARHTQKRDRASGVPMEILEHIPPKPESAYEMHNLRSHSETLGVGPSTVLADSPGVLIHTDVWESAGHSKAAGRVQSKSEQWENWPATCGGWEAGERTEWGWDHGAQRDWGDTWEGGAELSADAERAPGQVRALGLLPLSPTASWPLQVRSLGLKAWDLSPALDLPPGAGSALGLILQLAGPLMWLSWDPRTPLAKFSQMLSLLLPESAKRYLACDSQSLGMCVWDS